MVGSVRGGRGRAEEGRGHSRLQGGRGLGQPRLDLPQHEAAEDRRLDRRLQEGAGDRPQGGAVRPRPRLGLLVHEELGRVDRRLQQAPIQIEPKLAGEAQNGIAWAYFFKKDLRQRPRPHGEGGPGRAATTPASRRTSTAWRRRSRPGQAITEEEIQRAEKQREQEASRTRSTSWRTRPSGARTPLQRSRGMRDLAAIAGADSVPCSPTCCRADPDYNVREAAADALGNLGPTAKGAAKASSSAGTSPQWMLPSTRLRISWTR